METKKEFTAEEKAAFLAGKQEERAQLSKNINSLLFHAQTPWKDLGQAGQQQLLTMAYTLNSQKGFSWQALSSKQKDEAAKPLVALAKEYDDPEKKLTYERSTYLMDQQSKAIARIARMKPESKAEKASEKAAKKPRQKSRGMEM
jgi:hypothetical protein